MAAPLLARTPDDTRALCEAARARGKALGFVPTMGALHEGHLALAREARRLADVVVCSIFVNPAQFGPNEDFARYPRDLDGDVRKLEGLVDIVFAPQVEALYPVGERTRVRVSGLTDHLCGPHRPGHFEGVTTVVTKLFAVVGPCVAVFGKKDYQQLAVLRRMARDLLLPVQVAGYPIVREPDGLAMSSRNAYLSAEERSRALALSRGLAVAVRAFGEGERRAGVLRRLAGDLVTPASTSVDYVTVADAETLEPHADDALVAERALLAIACHVGRTRLLDNVVLGEDPSPV
jgi:pantoate--beta-alanine ligase